MARVRIWRNARVTWEETRLTGNVVILLNTGVSAHIHRRIPEGGYSTTYQGYIKETPETPAASNLFNIRDNNKRELFDKTRA